MRLPWRVELFLHYFTHMRSSCYLCGSVVHEIAPTLWTTYIIIAWILFDVGLLLGR